MLTDKQLGLYGRYGGDDSRMTPSELEVMTEEFWTTVEELLEGIWKIRNGEASPQERAQIETRIRLEFENQKAINHFMDISNRYWVRRMHQKGYVKPWWRFWE